MQSIQAGIDQATDTLPIGRRIREILYDKKQTPNAFYPKAGMSRGTFYACIEGRRHILPSELERIATALHVPIERIKQEDTRKKAEEIKELIRKRLNHKRVLQLSLELWQVALGQTEKCDVLNHIGTAHYFLKDYEQAHRAWLQAFELARVVHKDYGETERLFKLTDKLILSYTVRKDYASLHVLLNQLEPAFQQAAPEYAATINYSQAMVAYELGDMNSCKIKMYESLENFKATGNPVQIGKSYHNVAFVEYLLGDFNQARSLYEQAIQYLLNYQEPKHITLKDYAKTLLRLGCTKEAIQIIESSLQELHGTDQHELIGQFLLLAAFSTKDIKCALEVLELKGVPKQLCSIACRMLTNHYCDQGDSQNLIKYYKIAEKYNHSFEISFWEGV